MTFLKLYKHEISQAILAVLIGVLIILLLKEFGSTKRLEKQLSNSKKELREQKELAESLDFQLDKAQKEVKNFDSMLKTQKGLIVELRDAVLEKQQQNQELQLSVNQLSFDFEALKIDANFKEKQWSQKYDFVNNKLNQSIDKVEALQTQQSEKNQAIAQLESELNQVQARGDKMLSKNDKAWLTQFIEKQQTRYNDWQSTKKSILTEVVKKGLLHDLRDPLEDLLIEEDFITLQEQRQLSALGIGVLSQNWNLNATTEDAEYAYTSLYDNTVTAQGQPNSTIKVLNNEIQGSFRFNPQGTRAKSTPNLSEEEQEKRDFLSYYKQGLTQQAIEKGEQILERAPSNNGMLYNLSLLHIKRQEFDAAKTYSKKLIDLSEQNHQGHYLKGLIAYYEQDIEAAKSALGKAVTLNPQFAPAWLYFGHLLNYSNQYTEAKQAFEKVIEYQGESASVYYNLAVLSKKVNKPKEGVYYYQKSLDLGGKIDVELANDLLLSI